MSVTCFCDGHGVEPTVVSLWPLHTEPGYHQVRLYSHPAQADLRLGAGLVAPARAPPTQRPACPRHHHPARPTAPGRCVQSARSAQRRCGRVLVRLARPRPGFWLSWACRKRLPRWQAHRSFSATRVRAAPRAETVDERREARRIWVLERSVSEEQSST